MHANYLTDNFSRKSQDATIRELRNLIKKWNLQFDGFVVTGVSGVAMGSIMARLLRKDLVVVRKDGDGSHSSFEVENYKTSKRYIFLDDLIASGKTFRTVKMKLNKAFEDRKKCYFYNFNKKIDKKSKIIGQLLYSNVSYKPLG